MAEPPGRNTNYSWERYEYGQSIQNDPGRRRGTPSRCSRRAPTRGSGLYLGHGALAGGAVLFLHGLIHLMGVELLWKLGQPDELRYAEMSPVPGSAAGLAVGAVWLASAALFVLAAWLLVTRRARWHEAALVAVAVSVPVLGPSASMASVGLAVDAVVLLVVILTPGFARRPPNQPPQES